jgi:chromosome segregation ATPase
MALDPSNSSVFRNDDQSASAVIAALSVYLEPLVERARVAVVGSSDLGLEARVLELGARTVHVYDPDAERVARVSEAAPRGVSVRMLRDDFDVRDGAFDLVVIPDIGKLPDAAATIVRLRRVVDARGAVVAMGRARTAEPESTLFPELAPAVVEYAELYDLFALQFESVKMTAVLPFSGVVFAELGVGEDLAVSVDTRLVDPEPPGVFVVVAGRDASAVEPYAIVQVDPARGESTESPADDAHAHEVATAYAAMQLTVAMLTTQLDEHRARLLASDGACADAVALIERLTLERDAAHVRVLELEEIVAASQKALALLEHRLVSAERGMLERDDEIASLNAELDAQANEDLRVTEPVLETGPLVNEVLERAERAEASLVLHVADLAQLCEAHASETAGLETQLRERASLIVSMEQELGRRELLVRELVASLDEARDLGPEATAPKFEASTAFEGPSPAEVVRLRQRLDDLALEVARRDGELEARAWRITELENERARLAVRARTPALPEGEPETPKLRDELDSLRQALTQEHAARVAVESGEELVRLRAELARLQVLLDQVAGRAAERSTENGAATG